MSELNTPRDFLVNPLTLKININPNRLSVDKAIIFLKSFSYNALIPDMIIVKIEMNDKTML
jgi:hypothetical protein